MPACPIVALLLQVRSTAFWLDLKPALQVGVSTVSQDKMSMAGKIICSNGEATFIILLDRCVESVKLPSKRVFTPRDDHGCQPQTHNHYAWFGELVSGETWGIGRRSQEQQEECGVLYNSFL